MRSEARRARVARCPSIAVTTLVVGWAVFAPTSAWAFKFGTSFTPACHERITWRALDGLTLPVSELHSGGLSEDWSEPESAPELRLAEYFVSATGLNLAGGAGEPGGVKGGRALNSFLTGVRAPDIAGLAVKELTDLREIHLATTGQEAHFLRAQDDDSEQGSVAAAEAGRRYILELLDHSKRAFDNSPQVMEVDTWVEHYGRIRVPVIASAHYLGQALHALQDSFTHTYRSESLDRIYVVQTYIDAFRSDFDEDRDGPRHSDYFDNCEHPEVKPLEDAATQASLELVRAAQRYWRTGDRTAAEDVLDKWLRVREGCAVSSPYCETPWEPIGRKKETEPYLSCATAPAHPLALLTLGAAGAWWGLRLRRPRRPAR